MQKFSANNPEIFCVENFLGNIKKKLSTVEANFNQSNFLLHHNFLWGVSCSGLGFEATCFSSQREKSDADQVTIYTLKISLSSYCAQYSLFFLVPRIKTHSQNSFEKFLKCILPKNRIFNMV